MCVCIYKYDYNNFYFNMNKPGLLFFFFKDKIFSNLMKE